MKYGLIVGASGGLADVCIKNAFNDEDVLFCCDIKYKEIVVENNVHYIPMDATNNESIQKVYEYISNITDKLDFITNFQGIVTLGSLVELPIDTLDRIVNINLCSVYKINSTFFSLIKNGCGRYINIISEYSRICAIPFHGYYGITKHALEMYNDSLRRELQGSNVKVIGIRPGAFKTNMQANIMNQFEKMVSETRMYEVPLNKMKHIMVGELDKAKDSKEFIKTFKKALNSSRPRRYYNVKNSLKMKLLSILPMWLQDYAFKKFL